MIFLQGGDTEPPAAVLGIFAIFLVLAMVFTRVDSLAFLAAPRKLLELDAFPELDAFDVIHIQADDRANAADDPIPMMVSLASARGLAYWSAHGTS